MSEIRHKVFISVIFRGLCVCNILQRAYENSDEGRAKAPRWKTKEYVREHFPWNEKYFKKMSEWGAKIVRLHITPYDWREGVKNHGTAKLFEVTDQAVAWASKYKMYVIIDYHGIGFLPNLNYRNERVVATKEHMISFWDEVSKYYKDDKCVAFYELFNEPTYTSFPGGGIKKVIESPPKLSDWLAWKEVVEEIIDVIRKNDPDSVIIVGGLVWAYDISYAPRYPIERKNIVYATHPYPGNYQYKTWDEAFGKVTKKYPVFATEFSFSLPNSSKKETKENMYTGKGRYRDAIKAYLESKKISWTGFHFGMEGRGSALIKDIENCTPSEQGRFFKEWLLEKR